MAKVTVSQEELDRFESFLFEMDDVLDSFVTEAASNEVVLDYSLSSLPLLEEFLLARAAGADSEVLINRAARYLGEVFRKTVGGKWELCLKDPKYLYSRLPVISGYATTPIEFCPIEVVRNFLHSKRKGLLRTAVESDMEYKR